MERLMKLQATISRENLRKRMGKHYQVLLEGIDARGRYVGRSEFEAPEVDGVVYVYSDQKNLVGSFADVEMVSVTDHDLLGVIR